MLDNAVLKEIAANKWGRPQQRGTLSPLRDAHGIGERRASAVIGVDRTSVRYRRRCGDDAALRVRLRALAGGRRRFRYRRLGLLLKRERFVRNYKKFRRLYAEERLEVRKRGGRQRALGTRAPLALPAAVNQRWSLDFVADTLVDGRRFRILCKTACPSGRAV